MTNSAYIIVDCQFDFITNGPLAVPGTDGKWITDLLSRVFSAWNPPSMPVIATMDWHPPEHKSFRENGGIWPRHCVQDTPGAGLVFAEYYADEIILKGQHAQYESYSAFENERGDLTGLDQILKTRKIDTLVICGLATDYCVKATALDAKVKYGYKTIITLELCKGVAQKSTNLALEEMQDSGIIMKGRSDG